MALRSHLPAFVSRNFALNVLDGMLFATGAAFFTHAGLVPLFVSTLTPARWPIGLVTPVLLVGIAVTQLLGAAYAAGRPDLWRTLRVTSVAPRLWVLALAFVPFVPPPYTLPCFFGVWAMYALSLGFCIPIWATFVAQVIPARDRGKFFGLRAALGAVMGIAGTGGAAAVLAALPGPTGFAACFAIATALLTLSMLACWATRHDWRAFEAQRQEAGGAFWADARAAVARNPAFRSYLAARVCMTASTAATGYYAVHGAAVYHLTMAQGSLLAFAIVIVPNLTSVLWGVLADRLGNRWAQVPAIAAASVAHLVLAQTPALPVYVGCLVLAGLVNVVNQLVDNKYMMELDEERCGTLLGALNLALAPALLLLPALAGVLAELAGVPAVFVATGAALALATALLLLLTPARHPA